MRRAQTTLQADLRDYVRNYFACWGKVPTAGRIQADFHLSGRTTQQHIGDLKADGSWPTAIAKTEVAHD